MGIPRDAVAPIYMVLQILMVSTLSLQKLRSVPPCGLIRLGRFYFLTSISQSLNWAFWKDEVWRGYACVDHGKPSEPGYHGNHVSSNQVNMDHRIDFILRLMQTLVFIFLGQTMV